MKGLSPLIAVILLVAFTVGVAGILSIFFSSFTSTQTGTLEKGGTGLAECGGARINIVGVSSGSIVVSNPNKNKIYTTSVFDDTGATNSTIAVVEKAISSGSIATLSPGNIPGSGATKITVLGFCETATGSITNVSIEGVCTKTTSCWSS